jgi:hypothetical protein
MLHLHCIVGSASDCTPFRNQSHFHTVTLDWVPTNIVSRSEAARVSSLLREARCSRHLLVHSNQSDKSRSSHRLGTLRRRTLLSSPSTAVVLSPLLAR